MLQLDDKWSICIHTGHGANTSVIIIIDLKQRNTPQ